MSGTQIESTVNDNVFDHVRTKTLLRGEEPRKFEKDAMINVLKYMGFKNVQDNASALILNNFLYSISSFSQIQLGGSEPYLLRGNWYY